MIEERQYISEKKIVSNQKPFEMAEQAAVNGMGISPYKSNKSEKENRPSMIERGQ